MFNGNFNSHITIITTNAKNNEMIHLPTLERKNTKVSHPFIPIFLLVLAVLVFMENTWSFEYSGGSTVRGAPRPPVQPQQWQQQLHSSIPTDAWRSNVPLGGGLHMQPSGHSEHQHQTGGPSVPRTSTTRQPRHYSPRQQQTYHNQSWQRSPGRSPGRSPRNGFRQSTQISSSKPINVTLTNSEALVTLQSICPDDQLVVVLVGLPGCGKSTVAAAIAGVQDCAARTSIVENSEGNGSSRMSDISQSDLNLHTDHDDELPPPFRDIEVEEEGQQEQEQEQEHHNQSQRKWVVTCQDILKTRKKVLQVANGALMNGHSVIIDRCNFDVSQRVTWLNMAAEHIMHKNTTQRLNNHSQITEVNVTTTEEAKVLQQQAKVLQQQDDDDDVSSYQDEVAMLCRMGFDPVQATLAIQSSHGDIETAAAILLSSSSSELSYELPTPPPPPPTATTASSSSSSSMRLKSQLKIDTTCTSLNSHIVDINSHSQRQEADLPLTLDNSKKKGFNRLLTIGIVLPRPNDVSFCSNRAFSRGYDGIHDAGTDWSMVCERMKSDFQFPTMDEGFDGLYYCSEASDLQAITAILRSL